MDKLIEIGKTDIKIWHNTNIMCSNESWQKFLIYCGIFTNMTFSVSIDAVGKDGEYIRSGFDYSLFKRRIEEYKNHKNFRPNVLTLDITITSLSLFALRELCLFAIEHNIEIYSKLMFVFPYNAYLDINTITKSKINSVLIAIVFLDSPLTKNVRSSLKLAIDNYSPNYLSDYKHILDHYENARNEVGYLEMRTKYCLNIK